MHSIIEELKNSKSIITDLNYRWEKGIAHNIKSIELMEKISDVDFYFNGDFFCWKLGGDGDNGEELMYILDLIFDLEDLKNNIQG